MSVWCFDMVHHVRCFILSLKSTIKSNRMKPLCGASNRWDEFLVCAGLYARKHSLWYITLPIWRWMSQTQSEGEWHLPFGEVKSKFLNKRNGLMWWGCVTNFLPELSSFGIKDARFLTPWRGDKAKSATSVHMREHHCYIYLPWPPPKTAMAFHSHSNSHSQS